MSEHELRKYDAQPHRGDVRMSNEVTSLQYEIRLLNNEIFDIHNREYMTIDDVRELDGLMTQKAILIMRAHADAFPEASSTLREMMRALSSSDDDDDDEVARLRILRRLLGELMDAYNEATPGSERQDELLRIIQAVEQLLLVITMQRRSQTEDFGLSDDYDDIIDE